MKKLMTLALLLSAPAFAQDTPKNLACRNLSYSVVCNPNLPMPCPQPPLPYPQVFATVPLEVSSDSRYVAANASLSRDIMIEGHAFTVFAKGGYSMNADGTNYVPSLELQLTDKESGWTSESFIGAGLPQAPGITSVRIDMHRSTKLDNTGKISTATGIVICELQ